MWCVDTPSGVEIYCTGSSSFNIPTFHGVGFLVVNPILLYVLVIRKGTLADIRTPGKVYE